MKRSNEQRFRSGKVNIFKMCIYKLSYIYQLSSCFRISEWLIPNEDKRKIVIHTNVKSFSIDFIDISPKTKHKNNTLSISENTITMKIRISKPILNFNNIRGLILITP